MVPLVVPSLFGTRRNYRLCCVLIGYYYRSLGLYDRGFEKVRDTWRLMICMSRTETLENVEDVKNLSRQKLPL
jgi:hypothetical protein